MIPNADTTDYHPDTTAAPTIVRVWTIPATAQQMEQTAIMFSNGTRVTVATDERVKVGRDHHELHAEDMHRRNDGYGKPYPSGRPGSNAAANLYLYFTRRADARDTPAA